MVEVKNLLIGLLIASGLLTCLVTVLNEGNVLNSKIFGEDFAGLNKTLQVYGEVNNTGSSLLSEETQSEEGIFSIKGAFTSLKNTFGSIDYFGAFMNASLRILNAPLWVYLLVVGVIAVVFTFAVFGGALGGQP